MLDKSIQCTGPHTLANTHSLQVLTIL